MLRYRTIPVTPFQQNCSIVWCDRTMKGAVIDPGGELPRITAQARALGVTLEQIWLTHAHIDHAGGTGTLARELALPIIGPHEGDRFWIDGLAQQARMFGLAPAEPFTLSRRRPRHADREHHPAAVAVGRRHGVHPGPRAREQLRARAAHESLRRRHVMAARSRWPRARRAGEPSTAR
jgi:glyoxylase-like metal-dependent hydrolase (beta-lactamase superfamily II)